MESTKQNRKLNPSESLIDSIVTKIKRFGIFPNLILENKRNLPKQTTPKTESSTIIYNKNNKIKYTILKL